jgi:hypothetical protein
MPEQANAEEARIKALLEGWADAVRQHDLPAILAHGLSASYDRKGQAAVGACYFSGRKSSATASCSGTSGKKLSRWQ